LTKALIQLATLRAGMARAVGFHAEDVTEPAQIIPALERAFKADRPALVNVLTDWRARATTAPFSIYST